LNILKVDSGIKAVEDVDLDWIIWNNSSVYDSDYFTKIVS